MTAALLELDRVSKHFGGVHAVRDVSFALMPGEVLGVIGPNGAGKTTLVNLITGTVRPSSGAIRFDGTRIDGLKPYRIGRMGIARTFQVVRPFASLTVRENVAVGAMYGAGGARRSTHAAFEKADEMLELVGLVGRRGELADGLPVGGRKQLELAKALAMEPRVLLLDEVMAGLRGAEIDEAMRLVRLVHDRGVTLLLIEHVMKVIVGACSRVIVLDHGDKIAEGTPEQVTSNEAVVEAYLGKKYSASRRDGH
jgi:branched-chain amino acid transport system ATP-binding protein